MSWIGAAIGAIGSLVGGLASTSMNNTAAANLDSANRRWQETQWDKANEYNSPINQVQRYRDAGLNPALMTGQISSGNANPSPIPPQRGQNYSGIADSFSEALKTLFEVISLKKDIDLKDSQKQNVDANTQARLLENDVFSQMNDLKQQIWKNQILLQALNIDWKPRFNESNLENLQKRNSGLDYKNSILRYNADMTPTFLTLREAYERNQLQGQVHNLTNQKLQNDFLRKTLQSRVKNLQLRNSLLDLQYKNNWMQNHYLPAYLKLRERGQRFSNSLKHQALQLNQYKDSREWFKVITDLLPF